MSESQPLVKKYFVQFRIAHVPDREFYLQAKERKKGNRYSVGFTVDNNKPSEQRYYINMVQNSSSAKCRACSKVPLSDDCVDIIQWRYTWQSGYSFVRRARVQQEEKNDQQNEDYESDESDEHYASDEHDEDEYEYDDDEDEHDEDEHDEDEHDE
eukprot:221466_1